MKNRLSELLIQANQKESKQEKRSACIALFRIATQHIALLLAEAICSKRQNSLRDDNLKELPIEILKAPSDGTIISVILDLAIIATDENVINVAQVFWKEYPKEGRHCWRNLKNDDRVNIANLLTHYVTQRNDGVEGHGIPGAIDDEAEIDTIQIILDALELVIPVWNGEKYTYQNATGQILPLEILKQFDGNIICYRNIKSGANNKLIVSCQIEKGWFDKEYISYEVPNALHFGKPTPVSSYVISKSGIEDWNPLTNIPSRLTHNFTGREHEIAELTDWLNDVDSRACMIYGDGGIGKTTLTVEFLQRLIEGKIDTQYKPEMISFYTAKKTRWGLNGLEIINLSEAGISDVATHIARSLEGGNLDKTWYNKQPNELIAKLSSYLTNIWGIKRVNHLLILDNTETMSNSPEETRLLAKNISELSRHVGRILLTSRRREAIEARNIEIKPLTEDESLQFIRTRAIELKRTPLISAGESTIRKYCRKLQNKPLVLEVFVQAVGSHGISLEQAFDRVMRMQTQDLGEFLYTDAWNRLASEMRHLLLIMTNISDIHDETLLKLCCRHANVGVTQAFDILEESRGIAQIAQYDNNSQITFSTEFMKFCSERTFRINGIDVPTKESIEKIRSRYNEFLKSSTSKIQDRLSQAFRNPFAKAAHIASREGRDEDCEMYYELAVNDDKENGWLLDRYAFFLSTHYSGRQAEALDWAKRSVALLPQEKEAWFTKGAIESKLGMTNDGSTPIFMDHAGKTG